MDEGVERAAGKRGGAETGEGRRKRPGGSQLQEQPVCGRGAHTDGVSRKFQSESLGPKTPDLA